MTLNEYISYKELIINEKFRYKKDHTYLYGLIMSKTI